MARCSTTPRNGFTKKTCNLHCTLLRNDLLGPSGANVDWAEALPSKTSLPPPLSIAPPLTPGHTSTPPPRTFSPSDPGVSDGVTPGGGRWRRRWGGQPPPRPSTPPHPRAPVHPNPPGHPHHAVPRRPPPSMHGGGWGRESESDATVVVHKATQTPVRRCKRWWWVCDSHPHLRWGVAGSPAGYDKRSS